MEQGAVSSLHVTGINQTVFDLWLKGWRRRRIIKRPVPECWSTILQDRFWYWRVLQDDQRSRLLKLCAIFLNEKEIVVPAEVEDSEAARVTVAAAACLILLGFQDWYCFDRIRTVVLTEGSFRQKVHVGAIDGLLGEVWASGAYAYGSPVAVSWPDVEWECRNIQSHHNVVIHEFAHHIDDLDGTLAGDPPFPTAQLVERWRHVSEREYERLEELADEGRETVIDTYGLTDPVEFFAVSCEAYFCNPHALADAHAELFDLLKILFQLDPRPWFRSLR